MTRTMAWRIGTGDSGKLDRPLRASGATRYGGARAPRSTHRRRWHDTGAPASWRVVVVTLDQSVTQRGQKAGGAAVEVGHLAVGRAQRVGHMGIRAAAHGQPGGD